MSVRCGPKGDVVNEKKLIAVVVIVAFCLCGTLSLGIVCRSKMKSGARAKDITVLAETLARSIAKSNELIARREFDPATAALQELEPKITAMHDANIEEQLQRAMWDIGEAKRDYKAKLKQGYSVFEGQFISEGEKNRILTERKVEEDRRIAEEQRMVAERKPEQERRVTAARKQKEGHQRAETRKRVDKKPDFRQVRWGMTQAQVKERESKPPYIENPNGLVYIGVVDGVLCTHVYTFTDGVLSGAGLEVPDAQDQTEAVQTMLRAVEKRMTKDFGEPVKKMVYADTIATVWEGDRTRATILISVTGGGTSMDVTIMHVSVEYGDLPDLDP